MPTASFAAELELYGPLAHEPKRLSRRASRRYCRRLARRHYENFTVASLLLPRRLRQHFCNIYAYCRWADDLADETGDQLQALALLDWWERRLDECFQGEASHPVFVALAETVERFAIPRDPFADLLVAFRQDQRVVRYETFDQLLEYCRYSANPVGRLVLYLGDCHTEERCRLADSICTGLQLANFWQDVARDWDRGRIYLPIAHCRRFGYGEAAFECREFNESFRRLLAAEVAEAEGWLRRGLPLVRMVPDELRVDVSLFVHGGLAILDAIRRQNFDVWSQRPMVSRSEKLRMLARCWWRPAGNAEVGDNR
ncbi:MAG: squalene synthase HpnC [Pirellulales bacterium]|nr:squalene synthase HpnC [Pirellulales bacterium]